MGTGPNWQQHEYDLLKILIGEGLDNHQIADIMGRPRSSIATTAQRKFGGNPSYRQRVTKHAHLREGVLSYYKTHSFEATRIRFGLTPSEMKSLLTVSYKRPELRHIRKDKRTHDKWTEKELLFLLRHAGLQQRAWIAKKIKRGNARVIKEKLRNLGVNSRTLNGMTLSKYRQIFQCEPRITIDGNAGPGRGGTPTYFKIVPWVEIEAELRKGKIRTVDAFVAITEIMARFQRWIHGANAIASLQIAASVGHSPPRIKRTFIHHRP